MHVAHLLWDCVYQWLAINRFCSDLWAFDVTSTVFFSTFVDVEFVGLLITVRLNAIPFRLEQPGNGSFSIIHTLLDVPLKVAASKWQPIIHGLSGLWSVPVMSINIDATARKQSRRTAWECQTQWHMLWLILVFGWKKPSEDKKRQGKWSKLQQQWEKHQHYHQHHHW